MTPVSLRPFADLKAGKDTGFDRDCPQCRLVAPPKILAQGKTARQRSLTPGIAYGDCPEPATQNR